MSDKMQTPRNDSCSTTKEKSKELVQKESEKNVATTQLQVSDKKDCFEEGLDETQTTEHVAKLGRMEKSKSENSFMNLKREAEDEETVSGQAFDTNNASNSVNPVPNRRIASVFQVLERINVKVSRTHDAVEKLCDKFDDFYKLGNGRNNDYKSHFDAMYAKVLGESENNVPHDDINSNLTASAHVDNSGENIPKADFSDKTTECELQVGPNDVVLILDSTLFETREGYQIETASGDNSGLNNTTDERNNQQNKSLGTEMNVTSKEQGTPRDCSTERKMHVLKIQSANFKAKHLEPIIAVKGKTFRMCLDVSSFDIENITCVVGDKLEVHARVSRRNDYGFETHEIHQVFEVPELADREKFTACLNNGSLHIEVPMKHVTAAEGR